MNFTQVFHLTTADGSKRNFEKYYIEKLENFKKADFLLSVSNSSKHEAVDYIDFNPEKICTVYNVVDETFSPANLSTDKKDALFAKYGITKKMVMYAPGGFDIRKNFENLIIAYSKLPNEIRDTHQLVIVSKVQEGDRQNLENIAKKTGLEKDELIITGYVSDEELIALYSTCTLFVFPSLHEGFGLPLIEAAQSNIPIIARDIPVFKEVAKEFAYYFENTNEANVLCKAIKEWLELYKDDKHPKSQNMPWLTWQESTKILLDKIII